VREYLKRGVIQNAVNMPSLDYQQYTLMRPILPWRKNWERFWPMSFPPPVPYKRFRCVTAGGIAEWNTELIRNAAIQGVLNQSIAEKANV